MTAPINEKIKVVSVFEQGRMKPFLFSWRKRNYKILQVVFSYSKAVGKERIFYFSVDTGGGVFELAFNRENFGWQITKIF